VENDLAGLVALRHGIAHEGVALRRYERGCSTGHKRVGNRQAQTDLRIDAAADTGGLRLAENPIVRRMPAGLQEIGEL
jgi:hypothetical protein